MTREINKSVLINTSPMEVWESLTIPERMRQWMGDPEMHIDIVTDWQIGNAIVILGFHIVPFEAHGIVLQYEHQKLLQYSQLNSVSRLEDLPGNYTFLRFSLTATDDRTLLEINIQGFPTEVIYFHLDFYWNATIETIKRFCESIDDHWEI